MGTSTKPSLGAPSRWPFTDQPEYRPTEPSFGSGLLRNTAALLSNQLGLGRTESAPSKKSNYSGNLVSGPNELTKSSLEGGSQYVRDLAAEHP